MKIHVKTLEDQKKPEIAGAVFSSQYLSFANYPIWIGYSSGNPLASKGNLHQGNSRLSNTIFLSQE